MTFRYQGMEESFRKACKTIVLLAIFYVYRCTFHRARGLRISRVGVPDRYKRDDDEDD